jgi:sugar phosphate isomerase/epimerase
MTLNFPRGFFTLQCECSDSRFVMQTTRRKFLQSGFLCAAAITAKPGFAWAEDKAGTVSIGFQLWTVRGEFDRNVPGTLKALGQMGYKGVEFYGYGGTANVYKAYSAAQLRKLLDENGIKCCGMHVTLDALADERIKRTIENNRVLGNKYINLAMAPELMKTDAGIGKLAALLNRASAECRGQDMVVGYHCHPFDFAKINGRFAWEILFAQLKPEVNMQLDVGNCLSGGGDPIAMLKEFPGRTWSIHIKEHEDKTFDSGFYKEIFRLCETTCGTKWYIVEMGSKDGTGFEIPRAALDKLHAVGK